MNPTKQRIKNFLAENVQGADINEDLNLFATGMVNSLFAMQLVLFVEKEFSLTIGTEDLDLDNFKSINSIYELIARKTGSSVPSGEQV